MFSFSVAKQDKLARVGRIETSHGAIDTPYLVPVATSASVRTLDSFDLKKLGAQCVLANTYHLFLRPGDTVVKKLGGLHTFMDFQGPIFTDSGGFQTFSLGLGREHNINKLGFFPEGKRSEQKQKTLARVTDAGVHFQSIYDGSRHLLNPKSSMRIQRNLGGDIIMAFDECTSPLSDYDYTKKAMERTHRWALESLRYHDRKQALYGIIQGGWWKDLRDASTKFITDLPFEGIAIGGSLGHSKKDMHAILDRLVPQLDERPRHLLGIGEIDDIFECVARGVDTFDCVMPTRIARRGNLYIHPESGGRVSNKFRINIKSGKYKDDGKPIDPHCGCPTCRSVSRAYLRHLYSINELSYYRLATLHNLHFMLSLMGQIRESIKSGTFVKLKRKWLKG
ncbi:tRNA guanosine(34) transglycosylase Tgt [Candidatus Woesearchaeota archaeon]|nr:tRNA guanosine(34) transglycosylase Tgt [Candidatus Woesearchaeota archaeon]